MTGQFKFGARSNACLDTCDRRLVAVARIAIALSPYDFGIIEGHRSLARQAQLFAEGKSHIDGLTRKGKHNFDPASAFDFMPSGIVNGVPVWEDAQRFAVIAGVILATGNRLGVPLRWGGDWDGDGNAHDQRLHDLPHIEVKDP